MKRMCLSALVLIVASTGGLLAKDSGKSKDAPKDEGLVWPERAGQGPAVTLRFAHAPGKALVYEGSLELTQEGANSCAAQDAFYLSVVCAGQKNNMDQLAFQRMYSDRKRTEVNELGKRVEKALPNTAE